MIPSSHPCVSTCGAPNSSPAICGASASGERAKTSLLLRAAVAAVHAPSDSGVAFGATLYARVIEPPASGSPSTAYHGRSSGAVSTDVQVGSPVRVWPWSSERAVPWLASARSLMYSRSAESVPSSVSPPPLHMGTSFPTGWVAAGIHLKVCPPSSERQTYEMLDPRLPGTLV